MPENNLTIFQKLTKVFGFQPQVKPDIPSFKFTKDELLKTDSREDFERAKLQAQQSQYIADKWAKLDQSLYNQAIYYEPNRLSACYDYESMEFSINELTKIPTLNGFENIKDLAARGRDYEFITYAYDHNKKQVVPALARNAHYTRDEMTYKIIFDDDSFIIATYGHRFLKRDGTYCKVEDLKIGDSMMPFYRKSFYKQKKYNWVYTCNPKIGWHGWKPEHTLIAENMIRPLCENEVVHHKDFNGKNNLLENLEILDKHDHQSFHAKHNNKKLWQNPDYVAKMKIVAVSSKNYSWNGKRAGKNNPAYFEISWDKVVKYSQIFKTIRQTAQELKISVPKLRRTIKEKGYPSWEYFISNGNPKNKIFNNAGSNHPRYKHIPWDLLVETALSCKKATITAKKLNVTWHKIMDDIKRAGYNDWETFINAYDTTRTQKQEEENLVNHKIKSIEPYGIVPVYDLTVPGYKNFATDTIFSHNTPEVSASLDIFSEESCTISEKGQILTVFSESERIKSVLEDLFYNVLDINTNLQMWTRGMCKYGDNFVYLKIDPKEGIVACQQLPNIEIERIEGGSNTNATLITVKNSRSLSRELRFNWKNKDIEFQSWEVAHFRLLGDDRKLPYGTCLKSDSYIETDERYKQIKDINKGDFVYSFDTITQNKVSSKVIDTINSGKKTCYKLSTKHNYIDVSEEHRILYYNQINNKFDYKNTLDFKIGDLLVINNKKNKGKKIKIDKSLPIDYKKSQNYSIKNRYWNNIDDIIPDYITENFAELFGFLIGDGGIDIDRNTIWFAMGVDKDINDKFIEYLEKFTGRAGKIYKNIIYRIHSKALITILKRLGFSGLSHTKRIPNWIYESEDAIKESFINGLYLADGTITTDKWNCTRFTIELANENLVKDIKILIQSLGYKTGKITCRDRSKKDIFIRGKKIKNIRKSYGLNFYYSKYEQINKYDIIDRKTNDFILEPIISIEEIGEFETYDIYVENENHNFYANGIVVHNSILDKIRRIWKQLLLAEDAMLIYRTARAPERRVFKVFVGNMDDKDIEPYIQRIANKFKRDQVVDPANGQVDMRYNQMAVDQDYFIPVRDVAQTSPIETLPGGQNLGEIADIEYIQKKLLAALRIPKAYLGFEEIVGDGKNLALLDIRFARTINRIQKSIIQELNKIALIHLYVLGFEDELNNFTLGLTNPSTQADLLKIDQWKEKMIVYKDATTDQSQLGILPVSHTFAKKNILGMSDSEIILDLQQQRLERAIGAELMNTAPIIKRTGVFDEVDKKYGIPEEQRKALESMAAGGTQMPGAIPGGMAGLPGGLEAGGEMAGMGEAGMGTAPTTGRAEAAPLGELKNEKRPIIENKIDLNDLFDINKAQANIYLINQKLNELITENDE